MKVLFRQMTSVGLSLLLLFSTLSFHLDLHFCGDHLMDFSVTDKAASCGMEISSDQLPSGCIMAAMNCCSDVRIVLHGQDELTNSMDSFSLPPLMQWGALPVPPPYRFDEPLPETAKPAFKEYSPPPLIRKVHVLYETFLI